LPTDFNDSLSKSKIAIKFNGFQKPTAIQAPTVHLTVKITSDQIGLSNSLIFAKHIASTRDFPNTIHINKQVLVHSLMVGENPNVF